MRIAFLDIDGVFNHEIFYIKRYSKIKAGLLNSESVRDEYGDLFCPHSIENLGILIERTGCKLVISSSWRGSGLIAMQEMWKKRNYPGEVIDITPINLGVYDLQTEEYYDSVPRGVEIREWLEANYFKHIYYPPFEDQQKCKITSYVILDDDQDLLYEQRNNFVKTSRRSGFNKKCLNKAIKILMKDHVPPKYYL